MRHRASVWYCWRCWRCHGDYYAFLECLAACERRARGGRGA